MLEELCCCHRSTEVDRAQERNSGRYGDEILPLIKRQHILGQFSWLLAYWSQNSERLSCRSPKGRLLCGAGGGRKGQLPPLPSSIWTGGARIALLAEFCPPLLSSEGEFSGIVDSLVQEKCSGCKPPDHQIDHQLLGDQ